MIVSKLRSWGGRVFCSIEHYYRLQFLRDICGSSDIQTNVLFNYGISLETLNIRARDLLVGVGTARFL